MSTASAKEDRNNNIRLVQMADMMNESSDWKYLEKLIEKMTDINYRIPPYPRSSYWMKNHETYHGNTALHFASKRCSFEKDIGKVKILLRQGADVTIKNDKGETVVHQDFRMIHESRKKCRPLKRLYYPRAIKWALSAQVTSGNASNPRDNEGLSHLHIACMINHVEAVEFFLDGGESIDLRVNLNTEMAPGWSPLHFAVRSSSLDVIRVLLKRGANLQLLDLKDHRTPLHLCIKQNIRNVYVINDTWVDEYDYAKRLKYIEEGKEILKLLLETCIQSNCLVVDSSGLTTFHLACALGDSAIVESQLELVDDLDHAVISDAPNFPAYTGLHFAAHFSLETVIYLLEKGANIAVEDARGVSPFDICLKNFSAEEISSILKSQEALREILLSDGKTKLVDIVSAMRNSSAFKQFPKRKGFRSLAVRENSPVWSGFNILHVAVALTKSAWKTDFTSDDQPLKYVGNRTSGHDSDDINENDEHLEIIKECLRLGADVTVQDAHGSTPLHLAFGSQKLEVVELLLKHQFCGFNPMDNRNLSHLHIACASANATLVEKLISSGAEIEAPVLAPFKWFKSLGREYGFLPFNIIPGSTALHLAVASRSQDVVKILLKHGADPCAADYNDVTPIHRCMTNQSDESSAIGKILLKSGGLKDCVVEEIGLSHLHVACHLGDIKAVKRMLKRGANVNAMVFRCEMIEQFKLMPYQSRDVYGDLALGTPYAFLIDYVGFTPLHFATMWEEAREDIVRLLLKRGASLSSGSPRFSFICELLRFHERYDTIFAKFILPILKKKTKLQNQMIKDVGMTMLHIGCRVGDVKMVKKLLKAQVDVNAQIHRGSPIFPGSTALHILVDDNDIDDEDRNSIFRLLLDNGADATLVNGKNETAVHLLYEWNAHSPWLREMLDTYKDYSINPADDQGLSLLHIACITKNVSAVAQFLQHGADPNQSIDYLHGLDNCGRTSLHLVVLDDWDKTTFEIIDLLIENGADVNAEDLKGNTPLHLVAKLCDENGEERDREPFFRKLVDVGADVHAMNVRYETPLELLLKSNAASRKEIDFFLELGCKINAFNPVNKRGYLSHIFTRYRKNCSIRESLFDVYLNEKILNEVDDEGRTILHNIISNDSGLITCSNNHADFIGLLVRLIEAGCDIDRQDKKGRTILHLAVQFANAGTVRVLLSAGADINILDVDGKTPYVSSLESYVDTLNEMDSRSHSYDAINKIFALHLRKLQLAEFFIHEKNLRAHNDVLNKRTIEMREIESIFEEARDLEIGFSNVTLSDVLSETGVVAAYPMMLPHERDFFNDFFKNVHQNPLLKRFDGIKCLIKLQHRKALKRQLLLVSAKAGMEILFQCWMPELCYEAVIRFLTNGELENLIRSVKKLN